MQKIWLVAKRKGHRLPPALIFLYEPLQQEHNSLYTRLRSYRHQNFLDKPAPIKRKFKVSPAKQHPSDSSGEFRLRVKICAILKFSSSIEVTNKKPTIFNMRNFVRNQTKNPYRNLTYKLYSFTDYFCTFI